MSPMIIILRKEGSDMSVQHGGKTVYGASVGILMLETQFPRILETLATPTLGIFQFTIGLFAVQLSTMSYLAIRGIL